MKSIITSNGAFGGFTHVETLDDRYIADGIEYPFNVLGEGHSMGEWVAPIVVPVVEVPQVVTMRQARLALLQTGKLATVNAVIAGMSGEQGETARIEWEFSSEVKRHQPLVMALAPVLGMSAEDLDNLFIVAAGL